ncbi:MAG TPA: hypothetical protein P5248_07700 [Bacteroidales bacterium]|nr:hypothetical protein [Bacteroidales bacterium]
MNNTTDLCEYHILFSKLPVYADAVPLVFSSLRKAQQYMDVQGINRSDTLLHRVEGAPDKELLPSATVHINAQGFTVERCSFSRLDGPFVKGWIAFIDPFIQATDLGLAVYWIVAPSLNTHDWLVGKVEFSPALNWWQAYKANSQMHSVGNSTFLVAHKSASGAVREVMQRLMPHQHA